MKPCFVLYNSTYYLGGGGGGGGGGIPQCPHPLYETLSSKTVLLTEWVESMGVANQTTPNSHTFLPESGGSVVQLTMFGLISSFFRKFLSRFTETLAWTKLEMSMGSMARGKRKMLKRERATNALSAVSRSAGLLRLTRE